MDFVGKSTGPGSVPSVENRDGFLSVRGWRPVDRRPALAAMDDDRTKGGRLENVDAWATRCQRFDGDVGRSRCRRKRPASSTGD